MRDSSRHQLVAMNATLSGNAAHSVLYGVQYTSRAFLPTFYCYRMSGDGWGSVCNIGAAVSVKVLTFDNADPQATRHTRMWQRCV